MVNRLFICLVVLVVIVGRAKGQYEQWDTYVARFGKQPGSVLVNMGLKATAPDVRYPYVVATGPTAAKCDEHGMPAVGLLDELEGILDASAGVVAGLTAQVAVGTLTSGCQRLNYYYVKDTTSIRQGLQRLYAQRYPGYKYLVSIKPDAGWATYLTILYPSPETRLWMDNKKELDLLKSRGDDLTKTRDVNFEIYFPTDSASNAFVQEIRTKGYKTDNLPSGESSKLPYGVVAYKHSLVSMDILMQLSAELKAAALPYGGYYKGWHAPLGADSRH